METLALAGLPGTGKSSLAAEFARAGAHVLDKDRVRAALFGPSAVTYTRVQDAHVMRAVFGALEHLAGDPRPRLVVLDGRTYTRRGDVDELLAVLARLGQSPRIVECRCDARTARTRLERDAHERLHPADDRDPRLWDRLAAEAEPLEVDRLVLDTTIATPWDCFDAVLAKWPELRALLAVEP